MQNVCACRCVGGDGGGGDLLGLMDGGPQGC